MTVGAAKRMLKYRIRKLQNWKLIFFEEYELFVCAGNLDEWNQHSLKSFLYFFQFCFGNGVLIYNVSGPIYKRSVNCQISNEK
jgi:hypothetical protein